MQAQVPGPLILFHLCLAKKKEHEMSDWVKHKLESRLPGEISITSDTQTTPPFW